MCGRINKFPIAKSEMINKILLIDILATLIDKNKPKHKHTKILIILKLLIKFCLLKIFNTVCKSPLGK